MNTDDPTVLTINSGSSTIKFALFRVGQILERGLHGQIDGTDANARLVFTDPARNLVRSQCEWAFEPERTATALLDWLEAQHVFDSARGVCHRVVHGMRHTDPQLVTPALLAELRSIAAIDPVHMPRAIGIIEAFVDRRPELPQIACFDTAFHRSMPGVARMLPIPRRYQALGVERYGFHGLSYAYLMDTLRELGDPAAANGRVILAHLGNGASMAAVHAGRSIDTSMGFTTASGFPMGTRSGDLDPGIVTYLARTEQMSPAEFEHMVNHESGLLGISETSADMRDLLARESTDTRASESIELFCYQAKKWIGAFTAALGGLDTLVFAGGIGEHAPEVRRRMCRGLEFLGLELDGHRNAANESVISSDASRVTIRVIPTDEERMMAAGAARVLDVQHELGDTS